MEIFINARFLTQARTGVQRYAGEVVRALDMLIDTAEIGRQHSFTLLAPCRNCHQLDLKHIPLRHVGHLSGHFWEQLELPWFARKGFLLNLCNVAPAIKQNQSVTIHDAGVFAMPESYSRAFRIWYRWLTHRLASRSSYIITDSIFSKSEMEKYIAIPSTKIKCISLGCEHIKRPVADTDFLVKHGLLDKPYFLAVSSLSRRKNFEAIVAIAKRPEYPELNLVVVGGANPRVFGISQMVWPERISYLGEVNDSQLKALYQHAVGFVYPSFYEGFGLPPLEAMTCSCPVIVSDIPPHREVCGEAALYCDPHNIDDIISKMKILVTDTDKRRYLISQGRERAKTFSWMDTARHIYALIDNLAR